MILLFVLFNQGMLLQAVPPTIETLTIVELAKYGLAFLILGGIIIYQHRDSVAREKEYKDKIAKLELEIKALYELQGKEYKVQLEMLARTADVMMKLRGLVEAGSFKNQESDMATWRQTEIAKLLKEISDKLNL